MDENILRVLHEIGVPIAIISSAFVTVFMRSIHNNLAMVSASITLIAVAMYVPIELIPKARDALAETTLEINPNEFVALDALGQPTSVSITTKRGDELLESINIPLSDLSEWKKRTLFLERNASSKSFFIKAGKLKLGSISDDTITGKGFIRNHDIPDCSKKFHVANSERVFVGQRWSLGNTGTSLGRVSLKFEKIVDGVAKVTIESENFGEPYPQFVTIGNKSYDEQTFEGAYRVTIQVRAADFQKAGSEWAAFTVVI